ncbi:hypothetical protein KP509_23G032600 [Ceratopteris richardii]|uniref:Uncharacterized protein n=1 Tax=Ceratopteris richardii TaxID=49495 RepID=A0A8T2RYQ6_CERRI|nr:hypothetical protein KP509_23G032600 [Ceratopteris richardii]
MATELQLSCPSPHPAALAVPCGGNEKFESNSVVLNENECFLPTAVAMASSYPWGTWEDLLLASAVLRHGIDNWSKVSLELQARAYLVPASLFSAEACEVRFWILNSRFSSCSDNTVRDGKIPWFEEVRKLRIAQLKRELEHHDGAIGLLQKKLNCLKAENTRPGELEIRHSEKQDSQNSLALEKASSCSSACSTSHGIYTHINLGTASMTQLEIESGQISCSLASSVTEIGEIQGTISKSDMDELKDENPNQVKSTDCLLVNQPFENTDHNMHSCGTNQHLSICVNTKMRHGPPFGEIEEKPLEPQGHLHASQEDGMCFQIVEGAHHNNSAETDDVSYKVDIPKSACPNTAKDTCFGDASHLGGVEGANDFKIRALDDHTCGSVETCPASELLGVNKETHSNDSCFKDEITCIANCHSSVKGCANLATCQGKETKIAVSKACFTENLNVTSASFQDAFLNASAIDLLRIAYTDGTPVSTPEFETQPVDLERLEEPEGYHDVVSMCSPLLEELSDRQCKDVNNRGMGQHEVCADNAILNQAQERMDPVAFSAEVPKSALSLEAQELDNQSKSCTLNGRKSVSPEVSEE